MKISLVIHCITSDTFLNIVSARLSSAFQEFLLKGVLRAGNFRFSGITEARGSACLKTNEEKTEIENKGLKP